MGGGGRAFDHHIVGMGEGWGVGAGHLPTTFDQFFQMPRVCPGDAHG